MSNKSLFLFLGFLLLAVGIVFAYGSAVSVTSTNTVYADSCIIQGASVWTGTTDATSVTLWNGTGASATRICQIGGSDSMSYNIMFPAGVTADKGCYAVCSWSGTGVNNPRAYIYLK